MDSGPVGCGVETTAEGADGKQSPILEQMSNGIAIHTAVMAMIAGNRC